MAIFQRTLRYTARQIGSVETRPGCWNKQLIGVFDVVKPIDIGYIELAAYPLRECVRLEDDHDNGVYGARINTVAYHNLSKPLKQLGVSGKQNE